MPHDLSRHPVETQCHSKTGNLPRSLLTNPSASAQSALPVSLPTFPPLRLQPVAWSLTAWLLALLVFLLVLGIRFPALPSPLLYRLRLPARQAPLQVALPVPEFVAYPYPAPYPGDHSMNAHSYHYCPMAQQNPPSPQAIATIRHRNGVARRAILRKILRPFFYCGMCRQTTGTRKRALFLPYPLALAAAEAESGSRSAWGTGHASLAMQATRHHGHILLKAPPTNHLCRFATNFRPSPLARPLY